MTTNWNTKEDVYSDIIQRLETAIQSDRLMRQEVQKGHENTAKIERNVAVLQQQVQGLLNANNAVFAAVREMYDRLERYERRERAGVAERERIEAGERERRERFEVTGNGRDEVTGSDRIERETSDASKRQSVSCSGSYGPESVEESGDTFLTAPSSVSAETEGLQPTKMLSMSPETKTVPELLQEWYVNKPDCLSVHSREIKYGTSWRNGNTRYFFQKRKKVITFIDSLLADPNVGSPLRGLGRDAIGDILEAYRKEKELSLVKLGVQCLTPGFKHELADFAAKRC